LAGFFFRLLTLGLQAARWRAERPQSSPRPQFKSFVRSSSFTGISVTAGQPAENSELPRHRWQRRLARSPTNEQSRTARRKIEKSLHVVGMDNITDILTDACALIARIIMMAPPEQQAMMCKHVLHEIGGIVQTILTLDTIGTEH
jgi:hypothetical protein